MHPAFSVIFFTTLSGMGYGLWVLMGSQILLSDSANPQKNYFTLSNQDGEFEIRPSYESNDTLRPNLLSEYVESIEPPFYITHDSIENYDFAVRFRPNVTDAAISGKFHIQPRAFF